jgi:hypothetical protein
LYSNRHFTHAQYFYDVTCTHMLCVDRISLLDRASLSSPSRLLLLRLRIVGRFLPTPGVVVGNQHGTSVCWKPGLRGCKCVVGQDHHIANRAALLGTRYHPIVDELIQVFAERHQDGHGHPLRAGDVHDISEPVRILNELIGLDDVLACLVMSERYTVIIELSERISRVTVETPSTRRPQVSESTMLILSWNLLLVSMQRVLPPRTVEVP